MIDEVDYIQKEKIDEHIGEECKYTLYCKRCGYGWTRRLMSVLPRACPKCKNRRWND